jgi:Arc/MetJ-type ribon-helix-helix transcriptional regulator
MVRTQIQITEQQAEEVKRIARARRVSAAEIIREALDHLIRSGTGVTIAAEDRRARALNAVGKFSSGKREISRKHDKYLSEAFRK